MATNQLAPQKQTFSNYIGQPNVKNWMNSLLGNPIESQKFISSMTSAVSTNLALQECDNGTIVSSALLANALNLSLSPQLGLCYIVPFKDNKAKRTVATFILGYKGYIQLAIRSGLYRKLNVIAVKEGELVKYDPLNEEIEITLIEDDELREKTPTVGYYAMFEHINGFRKAIYWSKKKMVAHADKYSKAFKSEIARKVEAGEIPEQDAWKYSSFWYKDFDSMASKTMIRQIISKWGIMSLELQKGIENDADFKQEENTSFIQKEEQEPIYIQAESTEPETKVAIDTETEKHTDSEQDGFDFYK